MRPIDADVLSEKILDVVRCVIPESEFTEGYTSGLYAVTKQIEDEPTIEQPTWISCAERLPTEGGTYLVCQDFSMWGVEHKVIGLEQFVKQFGGWYCDGLKIKGITHWMPLPQPPKENTELGEHFKSSESKKFPKKEDADE